MAIKEQDGWVWTGEEKRWIKMWKRDVQSKLKGVTEQVNYFQKGLPEFVDEAVKSAQPYLRSAKTLLILADRAKQRTHLPVSADEALQLLYESEDRYKTWSVFMSRPDVQLAIRAYSRAVQKQRREQRRRLQAETRMSAQAAQSRRRDNHGGMT
jgi:hypothetical protein